MTVSGQAPPRRRLTVLNAETARFQCVYPSCAGACCKESRPPIEPGEDARIRKHLSRFVPLMRPRAQRTVNARGYKTARTKGGLPMLAIVDRYCVFYNEGCVLHKVGAAEGDKNKYKPGTCITFPLDVHREGQWYVRQWGEHDEGWDLACLDPKASKMRPEKSLAEEMAFAERVEAGKERWRERVK